MRSRGAFSLVEMLVVVALLSALLAVLLPGLDVARRAARKSACGSNLRQIALALDEYRADHKDQIPAVVASATPPADEPTPFAAWLVPAAWGQSSTGDAGYGFARYVRDAGVLRCPDQPSSAAVSYGRNGRIRVRRFDDIRDQARFPIVLDALLAQASTFADASGRHAGSANMLYMDSHVESVVLSALAVAGAAPLPGYPPGYDFLISFRVSGKYWSKLDVTLLQDGTGVSSLTLNSAGSAKNQQYFEMPVALLDPWRSSYAIRLRLTTSDKKHNTSVSIRVADQAYDRLATLDMSAPEATVDITADLRSALPPGAG